MALCPASTGDGASSNRMGAVVRATLLSSPGGRPPRLQQQQQLLLLQLIMNKHSKATSFTKHS